MAFPLMIAEPAADDPRAMIHRLFEAVTTADYEVARMLLMAGADPNLPTDRGARVLYQAIIKAKDASIVKLLLAYGSDTQAADALGYEAMHHWARAVGRGGAPHLLEIGEMLAAAGANLNAKRKHDGMTPLHHVAVRHNRRRGWMEFHKALLLVRLGANPLATMHNNLMPSHLILPNARLATRRLAELLTNRLVKSSDGVSWPTCGDPKCAWCA